MVQEQSNAKIYTEDILYSQEIAGSWRAQHLARPLATLTTMKI
jgi:hypothetical protein